MKALALSLILLIAAPALADKPTGYQRAAAYFQTDAEMFPRPPRGSSKKKHHAKKLAKKSVAKLSKPNKSASKTVAKSRRPASSDGLSIVLKKNKTKASKSAKPARKIAKR